MTTVCVAHACEFKVIKNEFDVLKKLEDGRDYRVESGDLYVCPVGGETIVTGFGSPMYPNHPSWEWIKEHANLTVMVK